MVAAHGVNCVTLVDVPLKSLGVLPIVLSEVQ